MFGYACRETPELMPAPIYYAHKILEDLTKARKSGELGMLGPDAKSQVTVRYVDGKPVGVTQIVLSTQHLDESADLGRHPPPRRALHPQDPAGGLDHARTPSGTSTRPASSSSAVPTAIAA